MNEGDRDPRHHSLAEIEDGIRSESPCSVPAVGGRPSKIRGSMKGTGKAERASSWRGKGSWAGPGWGQV